MLTLSQLKIILKMKGGKYAGRGSDLFSEKQ